MTTIMCDVCYRQFEQLPAYRHHQAERKGNRRVCNGSPELLINLTWDQQLLTQNQARRMHHMAEARRKKELLAVARWNIRAARLDPITIPVWVTLHHQPGDRRRRDTDGICPSLKMALDALVHEGVLPDDHSGIVHRSAHHIHDPAPGQAATWLGITPAAANKPETTK